MRTLRQRQRLRHGRTHSQVPSPMVLTSGGPRIDQWVFHEARRMDEVTRQVPAQGAPPLKTPGMPLHPLQRRPAPGTPSARRM